MPKKKIHKPIPPKLQYSKEEWVDILNTKLDYSKAGMFLHCDHCLTQYLDERDKNQGMSPESPRDTFHYEMSNYPFTYPNNTQVNIVVVWCKTCGRSIWDTRHLGNII
jgi:hypothetical protein